MTYHNAIKYIKTSPETWEGQINLDRVRLLLAFMGNPHKKIKYIRLAGSNGKTICAEMLTEVLKHTEHKVGCLKMPLRNDIKENISINCQQIEMEEITSLVKPLYHAEHELEKIFSVPEIPEKAQDSVDKDILISRMKSEKTPFKATRSELVFILALMYFQQQNCDFCIVEGENSRYDPSFILHYPFATVICGTIPVENEEVFKIKQYVKQGTREIVSAPQSKEAFSVISDVCTSVNCRLSIPERVSVSVKNLSLKNTEFCYKGKLYTLGLVGSFQVINACIAIEALKMIDRCGYEISEDAIASGLRGVKIKSKFEVISVHPTIIADSTHAQSAVRIICNSLADFKKQTGIKLNLCLPSSLIPEYTSYLTKLGYQIMKILIMDSNCTDLNEDYAIQNFKTAKSCAAYILAKIPRDELVLISGTYAYTDAIRFELIRKLSY